MVQRISPEQLILYNPYKSEVDLISVIDEPWEFENGLIMTVSAKCERNIRDIKEHIMHQRKRCKLSKNAWQESNLLYEFSKKILECFRRDKECIKSRKF